MTFQSKVEQFEGYTHYLSVPEKIAENFLRQNNKRLVCRINRDYSFHCALMTSKKNGYFITLSKRLMKERNIRQGDTLNITLQKDDSEYQMEMPDELAAALETDPDAAEIFRDLSPGRQRSIMHLVKSAKTTDTRIRRTLKILENLKLGARNPNEFLK